MILACIENEPFHSAYSRTEVLYVSPSTILNHLHDSLGMKIFYLRWISHELTGKLREIRIEKCREPLPMLDGAGEFSQPCDRRRELVSPSISPFCKMGRIAG
jgi:hypothetical protein